MPGSSWSLGLQSCLVCFQWIWKDHFTLKRKTGRYEERWACLLAPTNGCPIPTDAQATSGARTIKKMLVVFSFDELVAAFQVTIGLEEQDLCDFFFFFSFKSASNSPFLTMDKYQLPAAPQHKALRVQTHSVCHVHGRTSTSSNLPIAIKRWPSFNENVKTSWQDSVFQGTRELPGFPRIAKVTWRTGDPVL